MNNCPECNVPLQSIQAQRRAAASAEYLQAADLAKQHNMTLKQYDSAHYRLIGGGKAQELQDSTRWWIDLHPGTCHVRHVAGRKPRGPHLSLPKAWPLLDVVKAAVRATEVKQ